MFRGLESLSHSILHTTMNPATQSAPMRISMPIGHSLTRKHLVTIKTRITRDALDKWNSGTHRLWLVLARNVGPGPTNGDKDIVRIWPTNASPNTAGRKAKSKAAHHSVNKQDIKRDIN